MIFRFIVNEEIIFHSSSRNGTTSNCFDKLIRLIGLLPNFLNLSVNVILENAYF